MRWEEKAEEGKIETNQRLEAYAVKPLKLKELWGGEPQPNVGTGRDFPQKRREAVGEAG